MSNSLKIFYHFWVLEDPVLFLHSLFDGHPEISTLPGYFLKVGLTKNLGPFEARFSSKNWKDVLAEKICYYFEPLFDASSKKNVIGRPNDHTEWFARNRDLLN